MVSLGVTLSALIFYVTRGATIVFTLVILTAVQVFAFERTIEPAGFHFVVIAHIALQVVPLADLRDGKGQHQKGHGDYCHYKGKHDIRFLVAFRGVGGEARREIQFPPRPSQPPPRNNYAVTRAPKISTKSSVKITSRSSNISAKRA